MQELIYLAARLIHTGRRLKLAFGSGCTVVPIFRRLNNWHGPEPTDLHSIPIRTRSRRLPHAGCLPLPVEYSYLRFKTRVAEPLGTFIVPAR